MEVNIMQHWSDLERAHAHARNLRAEAAHARLARVSGNGGRRWARRGVARALLAFGNALVGAGRAIGSGEEISDGACAVR
jgi:hypothetical protein